MKNLVKKDISRVKFLYYNKQYSAREVAEALDVSMAIIYKFMRKNDLPRRNFFELNRIRFERKKPSFILKKSLTEKEKRLRIAGIMLYWAEGAKPQKKYRNCTVDLANSDSEMIKLFLKFLRIICGVNEKRLRILLYCYTNQDPEKLKKYWSNITKIPLNQFTKPYIRKDFLSEKSDKMKHGLIHIRYNDKKLLLQIQSWIEDYLKKTL